MGTDYGRLAYDKVQELEQRVSLQKNVGIGSAKFVCALGGKARERVLDFACQSSSAAVVVKVQYEGSGEIALYHNGLQAGACEANESGAGLILATVVASKQQNVLEIGASAGVKLVQCEAVLVGSSVTAFDSEQSPALCCGVFRVLLTKQAGDVLYYCTPFADKVDEELQFVPFCKCKRFVVCHTENDNFDVVFEDLWGNVWQTALDGSRNFEYVGKDIELKCVFCLHGRYYVFFKRGSKLYYCMRNVNASEYVGQRYFGEATAISGVSVIDNSHPPAFLLRGGSSCFIKQAEQHCEGFARVHLLARLEF